ncbi:MAG: hypothetical protein ACP5T4_02395 [Candidatus Micrarchaeia archaeon]
MAVDVNDIIIFKSRGVASAKQQTGQKEQKPAVQQQQSQTAQPQTIPEKQKYVEQAEKENPELETAITLEEEVRKKLEEQAAEEKQQIPVNVAETRPGKTKIEAGMFNLVAGILLLADASIFTFFSYAQYIYLVNELQKIGFATALTSYGTQLLNLVLLIGTAASGLIMLLRIGKGYVIAGAIAISLLIISSLEYLTSNTTYLAIVSAVTFISVGAIAYSRMSAVEVEEQEEIEPEEIVWPRIETF